MYQCTCVRLCVGVCARARVRAERPAAPHHSNQEVLIFAALLAGTTLFVCCLIHDFAPIHTTLNRVGRAPSPSHP